MRWLGLLFRIFGWLLTPIIALAATFLGAVGGTLLAPRLAEPRAALGVTALCGASAGLLAILAWLRLLRRNPEIRQALAISEQGIPDEFLDDPPPPPPPSTPTPPAP